MVQQNKKASDFFGFPLFIGSAGSLKKTLKTLLGGQGRAARLYYLNPHVFNLAWKNADLRNSLRRASLILPDGWGVVWAARRIGLLGTERLPLSDHLETLAQAAALSKKSLFLWGGQPGVAEIAAQKLKSRHKGLRIAGTAHGYQGPAGRQRVMLQVRKSKAAVLAVGMGSPAQEILCDQFSRKAGPQLYVTVGNALAFAAGTQKRAPRLIQTLRLEWVWRLLLEPAKMWRRYLLGNVIFIIRTFRGMSQQ